MRHGSLESGLGVFDYAAEMIGWENVFHCEINKFCQQVLKYYFPNARSYTDIFEFDATEWRGRVDIISAGFPCQPFSVAGKRKGSTDDRFIWAENMRIFREAKPKFIVAENVPGLLTIENGVVFEQVLSDLENEGYETQAFIIPACAKDAAHRRDRVWIVAYSNGIGKEQRQRQIGGLRNECRNGATVAVANSESSKCKSSGNTRTRVAGFTDGYINATNTNGSSAEHIDIFGQSGQGKHRGQSSSKKNGERQNNRVINGSEFKETWFEAATRLCSVDDEFAGRLDTTTISKSKWRTESLKAYGNAIYWDIAYEIFKSIEQTESKLKM